jgi:hypothetical protein
MKMSLAKAGVNCNYSGSMNPLSIGLYARYNTIIIFPKKRHQR